MVNAALAAFWSYLQDDRFQTNELVLALARILNLPAVIYCRFFTLPTGLPKSDESLYCWSIGFFLNIPYYAIVIFAALSLRRSFLNVRAPVIEP